MTESATIAAISTAPGAGAIAVIRLSGPEALKVLRQIFKPADGLQRWTPRLMRLGRVVDLQSGAIIDEALAVFFPAPQSFTGEDCAEIQGHGGPAVSGLVLEAVLAAGARLAEPGEFTRRAFLNGRLDLTQAEAVADLVAAGSAAESRLAAGQLAGALGRQIGLIRRELFSALADLSADLDFGDDRQPLNLPAMAERLVRGALEPLGELLADGRRGRPFREGLKLALLGAPNVGKSSLFNALAGEERALVSQRPGTTRDYLTTGALWAGLRVELCDTAGLSAAPVDELDALSQQRSRERLPRADLILWVRDSARPDDDEALYSDLLPPGRSLLVWNKLDLAAPPADPGRAGPSMAVSARTGQGLDELKSLILKTVTQSDDPRPPEIVPNIRHLAALARAEACLRAALSAVAEGQPPDICALELKSALTALDEICGRSTPDDLLDAIFSRFCLGK